jgi:two-component system, cell cycle sensor histidine kinase and response regulator CckA
LLAFSRKQPRRTEPVQLSALVQGMVPLLRTSLPASITLAVHTGVDDAPVLADRGQLEQVLVNLVLNARDAMPRGGELHLRVRSSEHDTTLEVSDTGTGIEETIRSRIFEPFFTTKPVGHGTGLGLAVVYGVISQAGGTVRAESTPGHGATFIITMPTVDDVAITAVPPVAAASDVAGTILLVDDDAAVRTTTRRLLQRLRYAVVEAASGAEALETFAAQRPQISVLLTDIRMPGMDGTELARQLRALAPGFPVVFISGFDAIGHTAVDGLDDVEMIPKPFTGEQLARALQAAVRGP